MIPKILHYCWFGNKPKPQSFHQCLESWKQFCPDFEIKEWTESNTKPYQNKFYTDALRKKKYAFASDCIRVQVLYEMGGIYLDTDMLLLKPIDTLLSLHFFTGDEVEGRVAYGFFGGYPKHRFFEKMKYFYDHNWFNQFSLPVITHAFSPLINRQNLVENEQIFTPEHFYALTYENKGQDFKKYINTNSYAVHLWEHSWSETSKDRFDLLKKLKIVLIDYLIYGYPKQYFIRYFRGFSRQLYHLLIGKFKK